MRLLLALVLIIGIAIAVLLSKEASEQKRQLAQWLGDSTGYDVAIDGDLSWRLIPSMGVSVSNIIATDDGQEIQVERINMEFRFRDLFGDVASWEISHLNLSEIRVVDKSAALRVSDLHLRNFAPNSPGQFQAELEYAPTAQAGSAGQDAGEGQ